MSSKQQALGNHIAGLEKNLSGGGGNRPQGNGWGDVDRLLSQKDELEEKVITLQAELQLARRREGDALAQLHDLRMQLQNTARSFTALTEYHSDGDEDFSDDYDDDDGAELYEEGESGTNVSSSAAESADSFTRPNQVPKLSIH